MKCEFGERYKYSLTQVIPKRPWLLCALLIYNFTHLRPTAWNVSTWCHRKPLRSTSGSSCREAEEEDGCAVFLLPGLRTLSGHLYHHLSHLSTLCAPLHFADFQRWRGSWKVKTIYLFHLSHFHWSRCLSSFGIRLPWCGRQSNTNETRTHVRRMGSRWWPHDRRWPWWR